MDTFILWLNVILSKLCDKSFQNRSFIISIIVRWGGYAIVLCSPPLRKLIKKSGLQTYVDINVTIQANICIISI